MEDHRRMAMTVLTLVAVTALLSWLSGDGHSAPAGVRIARIGFLYAFPMVLAALLLTGWRWTLMAGVMYGTIGLALDLSTIVQEVTQGQGRSLILALTGITGLLDFLLILLGGRAFLSPSPKPSG